MIVHAIEAVCAMVVCVTGMSLAFVAQLGLMRREEFRAILKEDVEAEILPFSYWNIKSKCPKCHRMWSKEEYRDWYVYNNVRFNGPDKQTACNNEKCPAHGVPHLHQSCRTCLSAWMMHTADYKEESPADRTV